MKQACFFVLAFLPAALAQPPASGSGEPPPHPSFGLQDPTILQRTPANKPVLGKAGPAPRLPDGKPDLSGPWEPNAIRENVNMKATGVQIPFSAQGEALYKSRLANLGKDDPEARCLPPGVPRLTTTPYPFRFVQMPNYIAILYEGGTHTWRQIFMDGRKFSQFAEDLWNGESIGHWEGDTLVVETTGFNDKTWIDAAGVPHSTQLKVTEHIRRLDADNMEIVSTVDDPVMYTKPWSFTTYPKRLQGELLEYICNENEKDVQHLQGKERQRVRFSMPHLRLYVPEEWLREEFQAETGFDARKLLDRLVEVVAGLRMENPAIEARRQALRARDPQRAVTEEEAHRDEKATRSGRIWFR